tara:strand:- start:2196 stop:4052 length:1857 start_codon:yes stop_codon:yes gene_type:complete
MRLSLPQALRNAANAIKKGHHDEAEIFLRAILKADPENANGNHYMGLLAVRAGNVDASIPYLDKALNLSPNDENILSNYVQILIKHDRYIEAEQILIRYKEVNPPNKLVGKLEKLLRNSNAGRIKNPQSKGDIKKQIDRLTSLYQSGELKDALLYALQLENEFEGNPVIPNILGAIYLQSSLFKDAILQFRKTVNLDLKNSQAHSNLGIALKNDGRFDQAVSSYKKSLVLEPSNSAAYNNLASAFGGLNLFELAVVILDRAIIIKTNYSDAYFNRGKFSIDLKKLEDAKYESIKAVILEPMFSKSYQNLAIVFEKQGSCSDGIKYSKRVLSIEPGNKEIHNNIANMFCAIGEYDAAIQHLSILCTPESEAKIFECLFKKGAYDQFTHRLRTVAPLDDRNIRLAAVSAFAANQLKIQDQYTFCAQPLNFLHLGELSSHLSNTQKFIESLLYEVGQMELLWEPENKTTRMGFQSSSTVFDAGKNCSLLENIIEKEIKNYRSKFLNEQCGFIRHWPADYGLRGWFVRLIQGGHQKSHIHPSGWLSGVVYLKTIDQEESQEGAIELSLHGYDLPILDKNFPRKVHIPKSGDIIMFPSSLFHRTLPFKKDSERCVIAFDVYPK